MATYDFIVVGSGPAGCVVASRLARSVKAPSVLLLEAGGDNAGENLRYLSDRFTTLLQPGLNWGYKTTPQAELNNRQLDYSRGKGLGGSTAINFAVWTVGSKDDYDEWARLVGDDAFNWHNARRRFDDIAHVNLEVNEKYQRYYRPEAKDHANRGKVYVENPPVWEWGMMEVTDVAEDFGYPINRDINTGTPLGIGLLPATSRGGIRNTAADAFLSDSPANLKIKNNCPVYKIIFEGSRAVGVVVDGGHYYAASKEVIICSGALDTPKLLKLSGIGPKDELSRHGIECIQNLPGVGANLQDHLFTSITIHLKDGLDDRPALFSNPAVLEAARKQFEESRSGPFTSVLHSCLIYFLQDPDLSSDPDFRALSPSTQAHILSPTVPHFEMLSQEPPLVPLPQDKSYFVLIIIPFHQQSRGAVTLASANPSDAPLCDPQLLTHPFDRTMLVRAVQQAMAYVRAPGFAPLLDDVVSAPTSAAEEDILEYVRENSATAWHMAGTAKMGREGDEMAVVDTGFRVKGVQGLRVADMSVVPFVPNCHVQAVAYQVGAIVAEKLCDEYGLN